MMSHHSNTHEGLGMIFHHKKSGAAVLLLALLTGCSSGVTVQENSTARILTEPNSDISPATADSSLVSSVEETAESERLGTKWGDDVDSKVKTVDLRRINDEPIEQMEIRYADKAYPGRVINSMSLLAGQVDFSAATDTGYLPLYRNDGSYYLRGQAGQAYSLVYRNNSAKTYEIVASVDGLNVLNGNAASRYDRGYVLRPNSHLMIEGFRKNQNSVASFTFSAPGDAYAANTAAGSISNTGVIGTTVYELYDPAKPKPEQPQAYPADNGYAPAPQ